MDKTIDQLCLPFITRTPLSRSSSLETGKEGRRHKIRSKRYPSYFAPEYIEEFESQIFIKCGFCNKLFNPFLPIVFIQNGKEYKSERWRKTCSDECGKKLINKNRQTKDHKLICKLCNKTFYSFRHNTEFCSNPCRNKDKRIIKHGNCKKCGKKFEISHHQLFCSAECRETQRHNFCLICNKLVKHHSQKYCSKECAIKAQLKKIKKQCPVCGKEFETTPCYIKSGKYNCCSYLCSRIDIKNRGIMKGENNPLWHGGSITYKDYGGGFVAGLRLQIRERDDYTCQICGTRENGRAYDCHHIDHNKKNNCPSNLILLCRPCHGPTKYYRLYWETYFKSKKLLPA